MLVLRLPRSFAGAGLCATAAFFPLPSSLRLTTHSAHSVASAPALDTAIARMGGADALQKIERVRFEMMTLWQRMGFEPRQSDLIQGFELHSDLRNYTLGTWRNTRRSVNGPLLRESVDIVQKDAAIRRFPAGQDGTLPPFAPLSIAYVDERKEIFAFT
ncbi:MAG TPA: hypothetical protein VM076_10540, partial [Gemmatimonadaceae bacterium]|nr:hypothetical protein [Gemmatimonadaceae bacterium]